MAKRKRSSGRRTTRRKTTTRRRKSVGRRSGRRSARTENQKAGLLGILGGILMLLTGVTGLSTWQRAGDAALRLTGIEALGAVFLILMFIGGLGGLAILFGSWLIMSNIRMRRKNRVKLGKTLISIGAGFGLFGLIILIIVSYLGNATGQLIIGANIGFIALILTIMARQKAVG